jgi:hypothetical protein
VVGHPHEVPGAVEQAGFLPRIGVSVARSIDAYEAHASPANPLRVVEARVVVQTRSRHPVAEEHGRPLGIAPGGVAYGPSVFELEQMVVAENTRHP